MKKIGIFTHPLISNYGGILQNFALQKVLIKNGYDPITVNRVYFQSDPILFLAKIKKFIFRHHNGKILFKKERNLVTEESQRFVKKHIKTIDLYNPTDNVILNSIKDLDVLVVGSDQVWRPSYVYNVYNEFLAFLPANDNRKRVSYAASFGTDDWEYTEMQRARCKKLIKQFSAVSVREKGGVLLCKQYLDRDATLVLDPTLLLNAEDYISTCSLKINESLQKNIFTYVLDRDGYKFDIIEKVRTTLNFVVKDNQPRHLAIDSGHIKFSVDNFRFPSIEGWLEGYYNADYVITDSFHGTVFAIIFNKPFIAIVNNERGRARFESLLSLFDLGHRLISNLSDVTPDLLNEEIDFYKINEQKEILKRLSIEFLINQL